MHTKKSIVVVDDEIKICDLIAEILIDQGFIVSCFTNGHDALQFIKKQKVDLIILDLYMPGMNGLELLKQVKQLDKQEEIIILSALSLEPAVKTEIKKQIFQFIDKPVDLINLVNSVNDALQVPRQSVTIST